jgi:cyclopropane-fatty-acyl-phospholipid synthase
MNDIATDVARGRGAAVTIDRFLRRQVLGRLAKLKHGGVLLEDDCGTGLLGTPASARPQAPLQLRVHDTAFYRAVAVNGSLGAGEAYMEGWWDCDQLVALVQLLLRNRALLDAMEGGSARLGGLAARLLHAGRRNTRRGSRRNVAAHYDVGNDFFRLILSSDLMYSSAIWDGPDDTLEAASTRKLEGVCRRLGLQPGHRVVEIGTGWGGFALHAARHHGCHVTTTTISAEQHALAMQRVAEAGLQERVRLLREDYRALDGRYDRLVSIEMIEAIGAQYLDEYFRQVGALLEADGLALLQAITIEDHRYERAVRSVDFIKRHVFPGSFIPSINAMLAAKTRTSDLALLELEDFGDSYARTLQAWRERLAAQLPAVRALGYDERFARMWRFYLAYCEGGFRERSIGVAHLLLAKPGYRREGRQA